MELKRPRQTGTTSRVGDCLQHEAALNVQARIDAEVRRRRQRERAQFLRFLMRGLLVVVLVGGGSWAWQKGWFDKYLGEDEREFEPVGDEAAADVSSSEDRNASASVGVGTESEGAVDALRAAEAKFAGATLGYWKNAAVEDRHRKLFREKCPFPLARPRGIWYAMSSFATQRATARLGAEVDP